jgi:mRNA interferase MazF
VKRGEVYWFTFEAPDKRRPVLILTRNSAIPILNTITVAPITSTVRGVPSEVALDRSDGMPMACAANFHNIQTISRHRLGGRVTHLSPDKMEAVEAAVAFALGLE